jgi:hypothetical protein
MRSPYVAPFASALLHKSSMSDGRARGENQSGPAWGAAIVARTLGYSVSVGAGRNEANFVLWSSARWGYLQLREARYPGGRIAGPHDERNGM